MRASSPDKTEEPFTLAYDYTLKDFTEGDKHRFTVPLPPLSIPELTDADLNRKTPFWRGYAGEQQNETRIELPKGWSAASPAPISLKESFADFERSSEVHEGVLITKRRLLLKTGAVTPDQLQSYKAFQKATWDDYATYIYLQASEDVTAGSSAAESAYRPKDVASYCKTHPTSYYGAPGSASGVNCSDWARQNQSKH